MANIPDYKWFIKMNKVYVKEKLEENKPKLSVINNYSSFFIYCCNVMDNYGWQGIDEMIDNYLNDNASWGEIQSRKRLFNTNVKEWNRLRKMVFERDNYTCTYCGKRGGILEIDHIIPFSKFGSDDIDNLTTACRNCNRSKKDKDVEIFLKSRRT